MRRQHFLHTPENIKRLEAKLERPLLNVDLPTLANLWQHEDIIVTCKCPLHFASQRDLPRRIRGALGNMLERMIGEDVWRHRDPFDREDPHFLLYHWNPSKGPGLLGQVEVSRPIVIETTVNGHDLEVRLRLFGFAMIHVPLVSVALEAALAQGLHSLSDHKSMRMTICARAHERVEGVSLPDVVPAQAILLHLMTPVEINSGHMANNQPRAILRSILTRVAAMAPWMGCCLDADEDALTDLISAWQIDAALESQNWTRFSTRDPNVAKRIDGVIGFLRVGGDIGELPLWLTLATLTHLGGDTASGFGRIEWQLVA
ncbi:MAG: hypothetical protein RLZZ157_23 [Pseudomonadota bacterium]|jgi:hypothetical protein